MADPSTRYLPGDWTLLARGDAWLLVDLAPDAGLVPRLWECLGERPDGRTLMGVLLESHSPFDLPGFAFAVRTPGGVELTVRHPAQGSCGAAALRPDDRSPWVTMPAVGELLVLTAPGSDTEQASTVLPLGTGLVPAAMVTVALEAPPEPGLPVPPEVVAEPPSAAVVEDPAPPIGEFARLLRGMPPEHEPILLAQPTEEPPPTLPSPAEEPPIQEPPAEELVAEELAAEELAAGDESSGGEHTLVWGDGTTPPEPPASSTPSPAPPGTGEPRTPEAAAEKVLAARCPAGHWTPVFARLCRVCQAPVPEQAPVEIPRPNLGVLRLANGDTIDLDRGAVLGRAPRPLDGVERPNLINLESFGRDVSRLHAQIVLDGWNVLVRDLGSANGTTVTLPGRMPERLVAHDLYPLEAGATIEIAEVATIRFEPARGS
ncbi:MAG: FHA domain-containing protein [Marmoricola sp.]